jgi:hypothetical protein
MRWNGAGGALMVAWLILGLLLIALLGVGLVWLVRQVSSNGDGRAGHQRPRPRVPRAT